MSEENKNLREPDATQDENIKLDDARRVKVLSPGMMVVKRFLRNKLAITGLVILIVMFLFSFVGALIMPYNQEQTFYRMEDTVKNYASATKNTELRYFVADGAKFSKGAYAKMVLAINKGQNTFNSDKIDYTLAKEGDNFYRMSTMNVLSDVSIRKKLFSYDDASGFTGTSEFRKVFEAAYLADEDTFEFDGVTYVIAREGRNAKIGLSQDAAVASMRVFDAYDAQDREYVNQFPFRYAAEKAVVEDQATFELDGREFSVEETEDEAVVYVMENGEKRAFAGISEMIVNAVDSAVFLPVPFKQLVCSAIETGGGNFEYEGAQYQVIRTNYGYDVKTLIPTQLLDSFSAPSPEHILGTDQNGMDMLTRLMFGGKISLMVGFVVVLLEMFIGIIIGGVSGYFGGWVDTVLMRFVDLFNCIPYWPIMIIAGSYMDSLKVTSNVRIFILMAVMGILGWTGIARVVRGQILALREQDFMVATEATGIKVSRRIFRHLVPNVMPLLIVQATMGLGSIILSEATLSYLGLGVKYPLASWGSIINAASNPYVVTNCWWIWLPAGLLILITVLGFNFVGDGLRDAFDPKMKR